jgi:hypothetical protein
MVIEISQESAVLVYWLSCEMEDWGIVERGKRDFFSTSSSILALVHIHPSVWGMFFASPGVKWLGHEAAWAQGYLLPFTIFLGIIVELCTTPVWNIHFPDVFFVRLNSYLVNLFGGGSCSCTNLGFLLNMCYAELHQATVYNYDKIFFLHRYMLNCFYRNKYTLLLYYFIKL